MKISISIACLFILLLNNPCTATTYCGPGFYRLLHSSDAIVIGTVLHSTETTETLDSRYGPRTCLFRIDEVLSGTLSNSSTIQVYRKYLRGLSYRNAYTAGEQLSLCLGPTNDSRVLPILPGVPTFQIEASVGEGEFPIVEGNAWVHKTSAASSEVYQGEKMTPVKLPLTQWRTLIHDLQHIPFEQWDTRMKQTHPNLATGQTGAVKHP